MFTFFAVGLFECFCIVFISVLVDGSDVVNPLRFSLDGEKWCFGCVEEFGFEQVLF